MTMTEESPIKALPLFGPITLDDMRKNDIVGKLAMKRVKEVCELSKGRYTVAAVTDGLLHGVCQLWGVMRPPADLTAIMLTAPRDGVLEVLLIGPDIEEALPFLPRLDGIARSERCAKVRMTGPGSWIRKGYTEGWHPVYTVYEKDLGAHRA